MLRKSQDEDHPVPWTSDSKFVLLTYHRLGWRTNLNPQQEYRRHNQHPRFQHLQDFLFWDLECIRFSIYSTSVKAHFDQTKIDQIGISGPSVRQSHWDCFLPDPTNQSSWQQICRLLIGSVMTIVLSAAVFSLLNSIKLSFPEIIIVAISFFSFRWVIFFSFEMKLTARNVNFPPKKLVRMIRMSHYFKNNLLKWIRLKL